MNSVNSPPRTGSHRVTIGCYPMLSPKKPSQSQLSSQSQSPQPPWKCPDELSSPTKRSSKILPKTPLLSILNVVVDHVMMPPSPMEPMEFREVHRHSQICGDINSEVDQLGQFYCDEKIDTETNSKSRSNKKENSLDKKIDTERDANVSENDCVSSFGDAFQNAFPTKSQDIAAPRDHDGGAMAAKKGGNLSNQLNIKVPVLRIFGPVIRNSQTEDENEKVCQSTSSQGNETGDENEKSKLNQIHNSKHTSKYLHQARKSNRKHKRRQQPQSGCLHIHGAFPYILARPLIAGPDGSIHNSLSQGQDTTVNGSKNPNFRSYGDFQGETPERIDWDDADSIAQIVEEVHARLEIALRASLDGSSSFSKTGDGPSAGSMATSSSAVEGKNRLNIHVKQVSIVVGRGFYTYSSGPPAPFLKIQYYDPSMRWRIKMILERGLELEEYCHPDAERYDWDDTAVGADGEAFGDLGGRSHGNSGMLFDEDNVSGLKPLKFRCYEAHIPYTMQVFKDYNLAGMKYIKVGDLRFRNPLPKQLRKRLKEDFTPTVGAGLADAGTAAVTIGNVEENAASDKNIKATPAAHSKSREEHDNRFFLAQTVPSQMLWPQFKDGIGSTQTDQNPKTPIKEPFEHAASICTKSVTGSNNRSIQVNQHWLQKETCCDLEFDTTVQQILNVNDVLHGTDDLPSQVEERQKVHWRAVPSLKEIWEQERKRMASLLRGADDFLAAKKEEKADTFDADDSSDEDESDDEDFAAKLSESTPPFTLNVKKNSSVPGTKLAVQGMQQLFRTSYGLDEDYRRALKDVVERHWDFLEALERGDQCFQNNSDHKEDSAQGKKHDVGFNQKYDAYRSDDDNQHATAENHRNHDWNDDVLTPLSPTLDAGIEALAALGDQFSQTTDTDNNLSTEGTPKSHLCVGSQTYSQPSSVATPLVRHLSRLHSYTCTPLSQMEKEEEKEMLAFGESVDKDDFIVSAEETMKNCANGLATHDHRKGNDDPYFLQEDHGDDFLNEEEQMNEEEFERALTSLASQAEGTKLSHVDAGSATGIAAGNTMEINDEFHGNRDGIGISHEIDSGFSYHHSQMLDVDEESHKEELTSYTSDEHDSPSNDQQNTTSQRSGSLVESQKKLKPSHSLELDLPLNNYLDCFIEPTINFSLRRGDVMNFTMQSQDSSKSTVKKWHDIPTFVLETTCPWFRFQWSYSEPSNVIFTNSFLEPVKRPPSFVQIKSWINSNVISRKRKTACSIRPFKKSNISEDVPQERDLKPNSLVPSQDSNRSVRFMDENTFEDGNIRSNLLVSPNLDTKSNNYPENSNVIKKGIEAENDLSSTDHNNLQCTAYTQYSQLNLTQEEGTPEDPLQGMGQQGGRIQVAGGGGLKTSINDPKNSAAEPSLASHTASVNDCTFTPLTIMSIEVHVQCRTKTGLKDQREIAMVPDSSRDAVFAVVYVYGRDPGGGESLEVLERGCVMVLVESRHNQGTNSSNSVASMGISSDIVVEKVQSEKNLLLRITNIVRLKDPDALVSWDTQGGGLGYLIERGNALGKPIDGNDGMVSATSSIDMARLLGRTPKASVPCESSSVGMKDIGFGSVQDERGEKEGDVHTWLGSGLGSEWDERVGAGAAAASIIGRIVLCCWKICSEECKHPNASYQQAMVASVLDKRIPYHDDLLLTRWYGGENGVQRWRVIEYRMVQAISNVLLLDALDILGRAGEAARLSGVEFSQSLPGIRGSQYKVEGVLLRALQSVQSNERGEKTGLNKAKDALCQATLTTSSSVSESQSQPASPWKILRSKPHKSLLGNTDEEPNLINKQDLGYFFYSPSKSDCANQEALECQALTLEPQSGFHFCPVVVCDFTALYPSLVIAYNLCYSTVAGKLDYHSTRREMRSFGKTTSHIGPFHYSEKRTASVIKHHMKSLFVDTDNDTETEHLISDGPKKRSSSRKKRDRAYAVPTGSIFVSESVVKGVLPQVLDELLSTRAMLKKAAKEYKKRVNNLSPAVLRQIEARQLALKYVANVTYGYTSATFSGRSAIPVVADAIVECGRRTLSNAIGLANSWGKEKSGRWHGAHVIYGDTDSVFIKLPGRSVKEAFAFGEEYCKAVTASNPPPVQLKLEKVYAACLLQTKKKYCGMMHESPTSAPTFEAKGIETVRRDQCKLTQDILKMALTTVFQHGIHATKQYLHRQWALIHSGRLPVADFVLTGRVRSRYRGGRIGPVQAALARRLAELDPGRVVRHKERQPYVIVASPGISFKLRECVLTPLELLEQWDAYTIHSVYYTTKHVNAALQRCFGLAPFKINIHHWYDASPKPRKRIHHWPLSKTGTSSMISAYFGSDTCSLCGQKCKSKGSSRSVVCPSCRADSVNVACTAMEWFNKTQKYANSLARICSSCNGCQESNSSFASEEFPDTLKRNRVSYERGRLSNPMANCVCIDCPITYKRHEVREMEIEARELCQALEF